MRYRLSLVSLLAFTASAAQGGTSATASLRAAAEGLADGATLRLEARTYRLTPDGARKMWLAPSNNETGEKAVAFPLEGKRDVTIDGNGATLLFDGSVFPFAALKCRNVTVRNLTIDKPDPVVAACTVAEARADGFVLKFAPGVRFAARDGELVFAADGREVTTADGLLALHALDRYDVQFLLSARGEGPVAGRDRNAFPAHYSLVAAEPLDAERVFLRYRGEDPGVWRCAKIRFAVGRPLGINLHPRRNIAFFFEDAQGVRLENVTIRRFGGMGVVAQRSSDIAIDRLRIVPQPGEASSTTADMIQIVNCCGRVSVENSEGSDSMDDVINVHGNYMGIRFCDGTNLVLRNFRELDRPGNDDRYGFFPVRVGDTLAFLRDADRRELARAKVKSIPNPDPDVAGCAARGVAPALAVTLEGALPALPADTVVENLTLYPDVTFRNNRFSRFPHLRLSGRGRILVEGNRLENAMNALLVYDLKRYWYEAGPVEDLTIRGNTFVDCNAQGGSAFVVIASRGWGEDAVVHGHILLENNRYEKLGGHPRVSCGGTRELIDRDTPAR